MRKFRVYVEDHEEFLEFPDDATDEEIEDACASTWHYLINDVADSGWDEVDDESCER